MNGVMLTLADGEKVVVGNEKRGVIYEKTGNVNIKQEGGMNWCTRMWKHRRTEM
ncbi:MAG: hypothetical protein ACLU4J_10970 [Butyricimonas paravirosa]